MAWVWLLTGRNKGVTSSFTKVIQSNDMGKVGAVIATGPNSTSTLYDQNSEPANLSSLSGVMEGRFDNPLYYKAER